jgi:hypothetical protein
MRPTSMGISVQMLYCCWCTLTKKSKVFEKLLYWRFDSHAIISNPGIPGMPGFTKMKSRNPGIVKMDRDCKPYPVVYI